ncbi:MAG: SDR family NAD(P)-dependent oxidoreductase [Candidatus Kapabacteria bacterium]|nr:SDR family NAD(P)-dependent oxidoreductase [Candidatus Kapabacteria bacterium]MDW7996423.1 SDR family NAD(P)-dependent oxidoreductase [Bacteroidota bacterium]
MLYGKTVLITGASSGIGAACAEKFAEAGARLLLLARRRRRLETLAEILRGRFGSDIRILVCDVRNRKAVHEALATIPPEWSVIDILINNAGLARGLAPIHEGAYKDWDEMIDTNLKGLLTITRAVLPSMVARREGMIVNIASIAGREIYPSGNVYCATKHAVRALSEAMRIDLNGTNIRVVNIDPGLVETEFSLVRFRGDVERARKVYEGLQPLRAEDIAEVVLFCATRPPHVVIADVLILPTAQANTWLVHRQGPR